jgi:hypothetical protein
MSKAKPSIRIRLACGHEFPVEARPNPRKEWPDAQTCPTHKRKFRVTEIHTSSKGKKDAKLGEAAGEDASEEAEVVS